MAQKDKPEFVQVSLRADFWRSNLPFLGNFNASEIAAPPKTKSGGSQ
jgi:hypothetical protein